MKFKAHRKQFRLAGPLAAAVTAVSITACGGGSAATLAEGTAPGHWTRAEISEFEAGTDFNASNSSDVCLARYIEQDMSFRNAMALQGLPWSDASSVSPVESTLVAKYGTSEGGDIYSQLKQAISDAAINCSN